MVPQDGVIEGTTQTSTLSLSSSQLEKLKTAGGGNRAHTFTCRIAVGDLNTAVTATQTINIYTPGIKRTFTDKVYIMSGRKAEIWSKHRQSHKK